MSIRRRAIAERMIRWTVDPDATPAQVAIAARVVESNSRLARFIAHQVRQGALNGEL